ncbi:LPS-assembly protein LptD [Sphingomonas bacterium]|uniref:LPS-assembly protein LptD n=1 Tax=Sphingomonas bacterium TaxID=1895847 RepID=UPI0015763589|nr:LPS assembly protein LptD [Sphingomonas bacterium]
MSRSLLLAGGVLTLAVPAHARASAQQAPLARPPATGSTADQQVQFAANALDYDNETDIVTATGEVRMTRAGQRLRADKVVWNRKTGQVVATGDIAVVNPQGDIAYGDRIELADSLKDGVVDNMLVVLERGSRFAATRGRRAQDGTLDLDHAAYTPCAVTNDAGCPREPSWKITALRVTYRPDRERVSFVSGRFHLFGLPSLPLPNLSISTGDHSESGVISPDLRFSHVNGLEVAVPYYLSLGPNRGLTLTPHLFTSVLPEMQVQYEALGTRGAFRLTGYATVSRRSDDLNTTEVGPTEQAFRGYVDGIARYQLSSTWSVSGSLRRTTDRTFLRRYDISRDDRLRSTAKLEHIDADSYFALDGWAVQTLRVADSQGMQPLALPEIDYRRLIRDAPLGGRLAIQLNSLALTRDAGQDTQRAFASARWDLRRLAAGGQELTLTAFARADAYNTHDTLATAVTSYRGLEGFHTRAIGAVAADLAWPLIGALGSGTQRFTPRVQVVASPHIANLTLPNEDSRAVDLDDSNLFALNRFPGYDRWEDSTRVTYGGEWAVDLPGVHVDAVIGQSYRLSERPSILPSGTGLSDRFSDITGRTEVRFRDLLSLTHRYRVDHDSLSFRRNEIDATVGSRSTYALIGYLRLDRKIFPSIEDLQDREEVRLGGRVQISRFWSLFGSTVIDLTDRAEDPLSLANGFDPRRHRIGFEYADDCIRLGLTWRRDYQDTGDARAGNSFLLTLAFTNLGR